MKELQLSDSNVATVIQETIEVLKNGGLVIFPSDTVYGVLVDATNEEAVKKLIAFKNRPIGKAISIFVHRSSIIDHVEVSGHEKMLEELLPGPFTVVLPSKHKTSKLLESEQGTLGIRYINYEPVTQLLAKFGKPVTATSANLAGRSPHYTIEGLLNDLPKEKQNLIDLIVNAGKLPRNKPSTVIDLSGSQIKIMRKGDIVFQNEQEYVSESPEQTKKIAKHLLEKIQNSKFKIQNSLVFILKGDLGAGKTVFAKGLAEALGITEDIVSPTYVIYYEYSVPSTDYKFYHFDLYNIEDPEEFKHLGIEKMLESKNVLCIEWGEKSGEIIGELKKKAHIVYITINHKSERERVINISY